MTIEPWLGDPAACPPEDPAACSVAPATPAPTGPEGAEPAPAEPADLSTAEPGAPTGTGTGPGAPGAIESAPACPVDPAVLCPTDVVPAPAPLERPADLPSEDQARTTAFDVLTAAGTDVTGADVRVVDAVTEWHVTVEPRVGDLLAVDLAATVAVGAGGRIEWASGWAGDFEDLGPYPLLDTRAALHRLNDGSVWGYATAESLRVEAGTDVAGGVAAEAHATLDEGRTAGGGSSAGRQDDPEARSGSASPGPMLPAPGPAPDPSAAPGETATGPPAVVDPPLPGAQPADPAAAPSDVPADPAEPAEPAGPPEPAGPSEVAEVAEVADVAVTDADIVLVAVPSWDGSGTYLIPGYRFAAEDGSTPVVPAVADEALVAPPAGGSDPATPPPAPAGEDPAPTTAEAPHQAAGEGTAPTTAEASAPAAGEGTAPITAEAPAPAGEDTPTTAEASEAGAPVGDGPPG
jgi:hypothetical protein